jgi:hypothetical protein
MKKKQGSVIIKILLHSLAAIPVIAAAVNKRNGVRLMKVIPV